MSVGVLSCAVNQLVFKKKISVNKKQPWYNKELKDMKKDLKCTKKNFNNQKSDSNWKLYIKKRNSYKYKLRSASNEYVQKSVRKNARNPKKLWKTLNSLYKPLINKIKTVKFDNNAETNNKIIAEKFNEFFVESIKKINESIISNNSNNDFMEKIKKVQNKFKFQTISLCTLKKVLKTVKDKKYIDNLNGRVLNDAIENPLFAIEFCKLINEILISGKIPTKWKVSTIVPIEKVKNTSNAAEFRPINMLPVYEKVLEIIMKNQIITFMTDSKVLIEEQAGFRSNFSCETSLNKVLNEWKLEIEKDKFIAAVFLDFKRAFETVDRKIMLKKLEIYGFSKEALDLLENYLSNRKQQTKFNDEISSQCSCDIGLPQGSVLSPLLFILYVNDMLNVVPNCNVNLFADDTLLWIAGDKLEESVKAMNIELQKINEWLSFNKLALNISKTKAMIITMRQFADLQNNHIKIGGDVLEYVENFKYLGVYIDNKLDFNKFCDFIENKMLQKYHMLKRISKKLTSKSLILLYNSLIAPHINYCSTVLFLFNEGQLERLQKIQNRIMRLILHAPWDTHINTMLDNLKWLSVKQ